jgi:hypothetical protein
VCEKNSRGWWKGVEGPICNTNSELIIVWFNKFEKPIIEVSVKQSVIQTTEREV